MNKVENIENRIAILLYLPEEISSAITHAKQKTQTFYPNHETHTPHITLYSCAFDESKLPELVSQIKSLNIHSFSVKLGQVVFSKLNKGNDNLFAALGFENETGLRKLHEEIWPIANTLRGGLVRSKDTERNKNGVYSQELFSFVETYGYEHVGQNFQPHVTLGEVSIGDTQKIDVLKESFRGVVGTEFLVDKIYVLLSTRKVPSEEKVKESEVVEIALDN